MGLIYRLHLLYVDRMERISERPDGHIPALIDANIRAFGPRAETVTRAKLYF